MVEVISLTEVGDDKYEFIFIQKSQPFGKVHKKDEKKTVHLEFICPREVCNGEYNRPTKTKFDDSIKMLKSQVTDSKILKFGVMGRGYKLIEGTVDQYQSRGLKIYGSVVYSFYDF